MSASVPVRRICGEKSEGNWLREVLQGILGNEIVGEEFCDEEHGKKNRGEREEP
jgi:hypothetical protein